MNSIIFFFFKAVCFMQLRVYKSGVGEPCQPVSSAFRHPCGDVHTLPAWGPRSSSERSHGSLLAPLTRGGLQLA